MVLQVIRRFLAAFCHESILFGRCFTARKEILSKENYDKLSAHLDKKKSSFRKLEPDEVRPDKKYGMENMSRVRASLCSHVFAHFQAVCAISFKQVVYCKKNKHMQIDKHLKQYIKIHKYALYFISVGVRKKGAPIDVNILNVLQVH